MRAVVCQAPGDPPLAALTSWPDPVAGPGEVLIAVRASGVSFANLLVLAGRHQNRADPPFIPGTEISGEVVACGPGVIDLAPGDRVCASLRRGGFAELAAVPRRTVYRLPDGIDHDAATHFPTLYGTAYAALRWRARLQPGETVLVHGAAGGTGLAAIEVARCLGARVIATAGSPAKAQACRRHGADLVVLHREQVFRDVVLAETAGRGADVIFDPVGGEVFAQSLRCVAPDGRLVVVGFADGAVPQVPANLLLVKNVDVIGLYWGQYLGWGRLPSRPDDEARVQAAMAELFAWHGQGRLRPETWARYPLGRWGDALACVSGREVIGRVVLDPTLPEEVGR
jgi:NADPH2:quinone reductase